MRDIEQQRIALECLKLAQDGSGDAGSIVTRAEAFYAFVTGEDQPTGFAAFQALVGAVAAEINRPRL